MRLTESRLRSIIRSVIRESYYESASTTKAKQMRQYQEHPNREIDRKARLAQFKDSDDFKSDVKNAYEKLMGFYYHPHVNPVARAKGMSTIDIGNLVHYASRGKFNEANPERDELQRELCELLGVRIYSTDLRKYIGNTKFWDEINKKLEDEIFSEDNI